jgi:tetratricopeptide (TPR) repeat protein
VIQQFIAFHENRTDLSVGQRQSLAELQQAVVGPYMPDRTFDAALGTMYPNYAAAGRAMIEGRYEQAAAAFERLSGSEDPYLAAQSQYLAGRVHVMREDFEAAQPWLVRANTTNLPYLVYRGRALYMLGLCQGRLLDIEAARMTLHRFLDQYPEAPMRMRVTAEQLVEQLGRIEGGSLREVTQRMDYSRRRLALADTAEGTQQQQQRIVDLLAELIRRAEEAEQGGGGGASQGGSSASLPMPAGGMPSGSGPSSAPATQSAVAPGEGRIGQLDESSTDSPGENWGNRPPREREEILDSIRARFPDRYRDLVEQYYRSLQETDR